MKINVKDSFLKDALADVILEYVEGEGDYDSAVLAKFSLSTKQVTKIIMDNPVIMGKIEKSLEVPYGCLVEMLFGNRHLTAELSKIFDKQTTKALNAEQEKRNGTQESAELNAIKLLKSKGYKVTN